MPKKGKLKIGMILDNEFTGDMRVENQVISLQKFGYQVYVLCLNHGSKNEHELYHGAEIIRLSISLFKKNKMKGFTNTFIDPYTRYWSKNLIKVIKKYSIDIIHAHDLYMLGAAFNANKKLSKKLPVIADLHENYPEALKNYKYTQVFPGKYIISIPKWERTEIEWLKKSDYVITVIEEAVERYVKLGIDAKKIHVVQNYVNADEFDSSTIDNEIVNRLSPYNTLTYIGGFDYHRGIEHVINSLPIIIQAIPDFKLILVGTGKNKDELIELSKTLNVEEHISFEGWQPPSKLTSYLVASDVCLIPHLKTIHTDNTIPHKLFQYMLLKKPVISSNCSPLKRIIENESCGLIYNSDDKLDLAEKTINIFSNTEMQKQMGLNGHKAVINSYSWKHAASNLIKLYSEIEEKL